MSPRIATTGPSPLRMIATTPVLPTRSTSSMPWPASSASIRSAVLCSCSDSSGLRWKCLYSASSDALWEARSDRMLWIDMRPPKRGMRCRPVNRKPGLARVKGVARKGRGRFPAPRPASNVRPGCDQRIEVFPLVPGNSRIQLLWQVDVADLSDAAHVVAGKPSHDVVAARCIGIGRRQGVLVDAASLRGFRRDPVPVHDYPLGPECDSDGCGRRTRVAHQAAD